MKGKTFFFNDITLLTEKVPVPSTNLFPHDTEIWFHVTFDSEYVVVGLSQLDKQFQGDYITFSDVFFEVTNTYYDNDEKKVLIINIKSKTTSKDY